MGKTNPFKMGETEKKSFIDDMTRNAFKDFHFIVCFLFFVFTKHGYLKLLTEAIPRNLVASALNGLANH